MANDDERNDDNVIPFPGGPNGETRPTTSVNALAQQLVDQLLASGQTPARLAAVHDATAPPGWGIQRRQPEPRSPRADRATYRVRIDLDGSQPRIWRRLELASDLTLAELHDVLQVAMGWTDSHLHHFEMGPRRDPQVMPFLNDFDVQEGDEGIHERDVRLDQVLCEVGERLFYEYDFGDGWDHTVELEAVTPYDEAAPRGRCTAGRRACPPEDCGGIGGYEQLLDGLQHPETAEEWLLERLDWMPDGFDPAAFSVEETNDLLVAALAGSETLASVSTMDLDENLTDLLARSTKPGPALARLLGAAELSATDVPDPETQKRMLRSLLRFTEMVGADGLTLTKAGYLPPSVVVELADLLGLHEPWMGKLNREENVPPVADLRDSAATLGLVRKLKGRLLLTRNGKRLASDPPALWWHVVESLPFGRDYERHAGVVALLATAAGEAPGEAVRRSGPEVLGRAGWWVEGGLDPWHAYRAARPTLVVLDFLGCTTGTTFDDGEATEEGRQLARAALRSRRG